MFPVGEKTSKGGFLPRKRVQKRSEFCRILTLVSNDFLAIS